MSWLRFANQHQTVIRWLHHVPGFREWLSARVWRELEAEPTFVAAMKEGLADLEAGRFVRWDDVRARLP